MGEHCDLCDADLGSRPGYRCCPDCAEKHERMAAWAEEARCAIEDELRSFVSGEEKQTWRMIDSLLSRYPGKQPTSRQITKDGE